MRPTAWLRFLSVLALALAAAGPLAALDIEVDSIQTAPAEPTSAERIVITVSGVSESSCFDFEHVQRFGENVDFVFSSCRVTPRLGDVPFTFSGAVGPLPSGTYRLRVMLGLRVLREEDLTVLPAAVTCSPGATALCLSHRRFRVEARWSANGQQGAGQAIDLGGATGAFSFFQPDNVEVVAKVIDGCALNGRYWVFAAGLTDAAVTLTVTDAATGARRTYRNPAGTPFAPVQDTAAFPCTAAAEAVALAAAPRAARDDGVLLRVAPFQPYDDEPVTLHYQVVLGSPCLLHDGLHRNGNTFDLVLGSCPIVPPPGPAVANLEEEVGLLAPGTYQMRLLFDGAVVETLAFTVREARGTCKPGADVLCLGDRRFVAQAAWQANGQAGSGQAAGITPDTGRFSFFDPDNVEVVVKVVDGCALNGHLWVFASGLTDVRTTLAVTDTATGTTRTYENPAGRPFAPVQDTAAFPCP